jgi:hypothetical protein
MTDEQMLINRLLEETQRLAGLPPYERRAVHLSLGELSMIAKGLGLLAAVRSAAK